MSHRPFRAAALYACGTEPACGRLSRFRLRSLVRLAVCAREAPRSSPALRRAPATNRPHAAGGSGRRRGVVRLARPHRPMAHECALVPAWRKCWPWPPGNCAPAHTNPKPRATSAANPRVNPARHRLRTGSRPDVTPKGATPGMIPSPSVMSPNAPDGPARWSGAFRSTSRERPRRPR